LLSWVFLLLLLLGQKNPVHWLMCGVGLHPLLAVDEVSTDDYHHHSCCQMSMKEHHVFGSHCCCWKLLLSFLSVLWGWGIEEVPVMMWRIV
jgi:hypothetical protein